MESSPMPSRRRPIVLFAVLVLAVLTAGVAVPDAFAGSLPRPITKDPLPWDFQCDAVRCPGATLLVPYFEVELTDPLARTSLVSITNMDAEPVLVRVVIWTNWGIPALGFDLRLDADELRSLHLGQLLHDGSLPASSFTEPESYPGCASPLAAPLDASALAALRARLSGRPDPEDGLCYSSAAGGDLATGYLTIDTVKGCSATALYPGDEGYFAGGGEGLAIDRNVLSGDVILLDDAHHRAEAFEAVALRADAGRFGPAVLPPAPPGGAAGPVPGTFYGFPNHDHRAPLSASYRTRYLGGEALGTEVLIWTQGQPDTRYPAGGALACGSLPRETYVGGTVREQTGLEHLPGFELTTPLRTQRLDVAGIEEFAGLEFGTLDLCTKSRSAFGALSPPTTLFQTWVVPLFSLRDRFSVGYHATPVRDPAFCS
jgi:hypothetical protein